MARDCDCGVMTARVVDAGPEVPRHVTFGSVGVNRHVVLLHGLGCSMEFMIPTGEHLASEGDGYVVAVDVPGFGRSMKPEGGLSIPKVVDRIEAVLETTGTLRPTVVGHSMGSIVGLQLAANTGGRACLIAGTPGVFFRGLRQPCDTLSSDPRALLSAAAMAAVGSLTLPNRLRRFGLGLTPVRWALLWPMLTRPSVLSGNAIADVLENSGGLTTLEALVVAKKLDLSEFLRSVAGVPTAMIQGARDSVRTVTDDEMFRSILDPIGEWEVPEAGHWPMLDNWAGYISALGEAMRSLELA